MLIIITCSAALEQTYFETPLKGACNAPSRYWVPHPVGLHPTDEIATHVNLGRSVGPEKCNGSRRCSAGNRCTNIRLIGLPKRSV